MKPNRRKLKNLLINPPYQLKYVSLLFSSAFILTAINVGIIYNYVKENYTFLVDLSPMTDEAKKQLYLELQQLIWILGGSSTFFLIFIIILGLFLSHRTAGPLYHFKRVFDEIASGHQERRVNLRPKDEFLDVAKSFNQMMERLTSKKN